MERDSTAGIHRRPRPIVATNERPKERANPLMTLSDSSLFAWHDTTGDPNNMFPPSAEWNPSSFLRQLQHNLTVQQSAASTLSVGKASFPSLSSSSAPFPQSPPFFTQSLREPIYRRDNNHDNIPPVAVADVNDDTRLDLESIRSFSADLRNTSPGNSVSTIISPRLNNSPIKRRRVQNVSSRCRIVGQVVGQKRVSKVVALCNEIRRIQSTTTTNTSGDDSSQPQVVQDLVANTVLVDAWESTPLNDLKALPWDQLLATAERHMAAYREWQATS